MANDASKMFHIVPYKGSGNDSIYVGNRERLKITHVGEAKSNTDNGELDLKMFWWILNLRKIYCLLANLRQSILAQLNSYLMIL